MSRSAEIDRNNIKTSARAPPQPRNPFPFIISHNIPRLSCAENTRQWLRQCRQETFAWLQLLGFESWLPLIQLERWQICAIKNKALAFFKPSVFLGYAKERTRVSKARWHLKHTSFIFQVVCHQLRARSLTPMIASQSGGGNNALFFSLLRPRCSEKRRCCD